LLTRQPGLLLQLVERVRTECLREFVRCKTLVLPCSDPGVDMVAVAALTELIKQATQPTPRATASAEQPTQQTTQASRERAAKVTRHPTAETSILASEHAAKASLTTQDVPEPAAGGTTLRTGAGVLEGLSRQEHHKRLDDWRGCSAAPLCRGASGSHHVAQK
jgi:hypothetical protein